MTSNGYREAELWLRLVGGFAVTQWDQNPLPGPVGSRKARTLLALLAVEPRRPVPVDRVIEAVWPETPPRRPADVAATLVSRLRAVLGREAVAGDRAGYQLGRRLRVDVHEAGVMLARAEARLSGGAPAAALALAGRAHALLDGGPVLADQPDAIWAEPARARHTGLLRHARHLIAQAALATGQPRTAVAAAEAARAADPLDEVACRALLRGYSAAGEPARGLAGYARLRAALRDELGVDPAPATQAVHLAVLRNRPVAGSGSLPGTGAATELAGPGMAEFL